MEAKEREREGEDRGGEDCLPSNWGLWTRQWRREGREKGKEGSLSWASRHFFFHFKHWLYQTSRISVLMMVSALCSCLYAENFLSLRPDKFRSNSFCVVKVKVKVRLFLNGETPSQNYGVSIAIITQCYLPPDTREHTPP